MVPPRECGRCGCSKRGRVPVPGERGAVWLFEPGFGPASAQVRRVRHRVQPMARAGEPPRYTPERSEWGRGAGSASARWAGRLERERAKARRNEHYRDL
jgi:hypothetical protein